MPNVTPQYILSKRRDTSSNLPRRIIDDKGELSEQENKSILESLFLACEILIYYCNHWLLYSYLFTLFVNCKILLANTE